jgi:hypothetical protein
MDCSGLRGALLRPVDPLERPEKLEETLRRRQLPWGRLVDGDDAGDKVFPCWQLAYRDARVVSFRLPAVFAVLGEFRPMRNEKPRPPTLIMDCMNTSTRSSKFLTNY